jgi:fructosamine-3-kinase
MTNQQFWAEVAQQISEVIGDRLTKTNYQWRSVGGGCINQTYCLYNPSYKFFVKVNTIDQASNFRMEYFALAEIKNTGTITVPEPICVGTANQQCFLVLEWLDLHSSHQEQDWQLLGKQLAQLHRVTSKQGFGWHHNNSIGSTPQINTWHSNWVDFWIENRLKPQFAMAHRNGFYSRTPLEDLWSAVPRYFDSYQPIPSLVHGDLWSGNLAFCNRQPVIFDPALYYGDREVDIAMTELFGRLPNAFYESYNQHFPLDRGYPQRRNLYNLYHILNHFNLFGGGYAVQADRLISELVR